VYAAMFGCGRGQDRSDKEESEKTGERESERQSTTGYVE